MMKSTPSNCIDHPYLMKATEVLETCLMVINEKMPGGQEEERILLLQSLIESPEALELTVGDRRLLFEGKVSLEKDGKVKERYFILFTDKLLICTINKSIFGNMKYLLKYLIATDQFLINAFPKPAIAEDVKGMEKMDKKGYFQFVWAGNTKFGVCECSSLLLGFLLFLRSLLLSSFFSVCSQIAKPKLKRKTLSNSSTRPA